MCVGKRCIGCVQATLLHLKIRSFVKKIGVFPIALVGQGAPKVSVVVLFFCFVKWFCCCSKV